MAKPDDAVRVNQDVAALLRCVGDGPTGEGAPERLLGVGEQRPGSHEVTPLCPLQTVLSIELAPLVHQNWPAHSRLSHILRRSCLAFERDDKHADPKVA